MIITANGSDQARLNEFVVLLCGTENSKSLGASDLDYLVWDSWNGIGTLLYIKVSSRSGYDDFEYKLNYLVEAENATASEGSIRTVQRNTKHAGIKLLVRCFHLIGAKLIVS